MSPRGTRTTTFVLTLFLFNIALIPSTRGDRGAKDGDDEYMSRAEILDMREKVREMFYHGYDNYLRFAFPHDELKPLTGTYTDSLAELGNAKLDKESTYQGVAMTLIDTLDTLAVLGNKTEFSRAVNWVVDNVSFDQDVRVNVFEANIRLLGGLLSAHYLASNHELHLMPDYEGGLLSLAKDLGNRLLSAFADRYDRLFPYAWVNLKKGVQAGEVSDTCTAGIGTLILEFGLLSHYTGDFVYYHVANQALDRLWKLRSSLGLFGNTLDGKTGVWRNHNAGIGAGIDSFYEYLFKAYVMFGDNKFLKMFTETYTAVNSHLKSGPWYVEVDMHSARPTHVQFNSLQAFWPGLQVMFGDVNSAETTQAAFFSVWERYGALPERYLLKSQVLHSTERYYPLRPEIVESTYYLYRATKNQKYLRMGRTMLESLNSISRVERGYASIKDVKAKVLEDRMTSFFLAELVKYLYLLFDDDNFLHSTNITDHVFTTEGHILPLTTALHEEFVGTLLPSEDEREDGDVQESEPSSRTRTLFTCEKPEEIPSPLEAVMTKIENQKKSESAERESAKEDDNANNQGTCQNGGQRFNHGRLNIEVGAGSFFLQHDSGELVHIRNLGTSSVELVNMVPGKSARSLVLDGGRGVISYVVREVTSKTTGPSATEVDNEESTEFPASIALFSHEPLAKELQTSGKRRDAAGSIPPRGGSTLHVFAEGIVKRSVPSMGCQPFTNANEVANNIVYVDRGDCTFVEKILHAQKAGASAVIVGNTNAVEGEEAMHFMMGGDGTDRVVQIPALMIPKTAADKIVTILKHKEQAQSAIEPVFQLVRRVHLPPPQIQRDSEGRTIIKGTVTLTGESVGGVNSRKVLDNENKSKPLPGSVIPGSMRSREGKVDSFHYRTQGGWHVHVQQQNNVFLLSVQDV